MLQTVSADCLLCTMYLQCERGLRGVIRHNLSGEKLSIMHEATARYNVTPKSTLIFFYILLTLRGFEAS